MTAMTGRGAIHGDPGLGDLSRDEGVRPSLPAAPVEHHRRVTAMRRTEDCVCGGEITAEAGWEPAAVDAHNLTALHQMWRRWREASL